MSYRIDFHETGDKLIGLAVITFLAWNPSGMIYALKCMQT